MAKLSPLEIGPKRTHVKDIFTAPPDLHTTSSDEPGTVDKTHNTTRQPGDSNNEKPSLLNSDAKHCHVKKQTMKSTTQSWVARDGTVTRLNSRKKRPAPKPPTSCSLENRPDSYTDTPQSYKDTRDTYNVRRDSYNERNTVRHSLDDEKDPHQQQQQHRHLVTDKAVQRTSQECDENKRLSTDCQHNDRVQRRDVINESEIVDDGRGSRTTAVIGRRAADVTTSLEDNATSVSVLSDFGTTSSSSGYTSDIPDLTQRTSVVMKKQQQEDEEGFGEDECVLDFDDEDEDDEYGEEGGGGRSGRTMLYKEYRGEDFSRYLEDDQQSGMEQTPAVAPPARKSRYTKRSVGHVTPNGSLTDYERKKGLKQRLSQMFTLSRQQNHAAVHSNAGRNSIQNFSFADSKIGEHIASDNDPDRLITALSDIGLRQPWSGADTLAFRTLSRRPEAKTRPNRSSSVGDILEQTNSEFTEDFESRRKSQMYDSKLLAKNSKKSNSLWSKLGKSRKKKNSKSQYELDNTTDNPLIQEGATDIRL